MKKEELIKSSINEFVTFGLFLVLCSILNFEKIVPKLQTNSLISSSASDDLSVIQNTFALIIFGFV